jgi:deoxyribodipyrimidine photo-lyase
MSVADLGLLSPLNWQESLAPHWQIGEQGALDRLRRFLAQGLPGYKEQRDFPARPQVSRLSPHLHFGEISPHQVWREATQAAPGGSDRDHFLSELGWREFSYYLLYHCPTMPEENLQPRFDRFPWQWESPFLAAWQRGQTGIPLVDAGMRELWQTGFMHNRVRMITASFLVKNLLLDWRLGAQWFWDCLVDADLASNSAGWQWVAGCGTDASPYFRIFNPVTQGKKFDPHGEYVRRYVPELAQVPDKYVHCPWEAPDLSLREAGVTLGEHYPRPVVSLKDSREQALAALASLK